MVTDPQKWQNKVLDIFAQSCLGAAQPIHMIIWCMSQERSHPALFAAMVDLAEYVPVIIVHTRAGGRRTQIAEFSAFLRGEAPPPENLKASIPPPSAVRSFLQLSVHAKTGYIPETGEVDGCPAFGLDRLTESIASSYKRGCIMMASWQVINRADRNKKAKIAIGASMGLAAAAGATPVPIADDIAVLAVICGMITRLGIIYRRRLRPGRVWKIVKSHILSLKSFAGFSVLGFIAAADALSDALKVTGVLTIPGMVVGGVAAMLATFIIGRVILDALKTCDCEERNFDDAFEAALMKSLQDSSKRGLTESLAAARSFQEKHTHKSLVGGQASIGGL